MEIAQIIYPHHNQDIPIYAASKVRFAHDPSKRGGRCRVAHEACYNESRRTHATATVFQSALRAGCQMKYTII